MKMDDDQFRMRFGRRLKKPLKPRKKKYRQVRSKQATTRLQKRKRVREYLDFHLAHGKTEFHAPDVAKELGMTSREVGRLMCDCLSESDHANHTRTRWNRTIQFNERERRVGDP
jgi:hypothetical protein